VFISLEGIDGSGKTTQAELLARALGPRTVVVREPGGTPAAERVRELLADRSLEVEPLTELLLFCAARADLVKRVIRPALEDGLDVVSDRFADSSIAYQGAGRDVGVELVESLNDAATAGTEPDLTVYLRIDPELGAARAAGQDRIEAEGLYLQRRVADAYEEIARRHHDRITVVDAGGSVEEVHEAVLAAVEARRT
jgi:dTMP kinase